MTPAAKIKVVLAVLGSVALFFLVVARIESSEEHQAIRVMDVVIGLSGRRRGERHETK
jgi:hypothetical protein